MLYIAVLLTSLIVMAFLGFKNPHFVRIEWNKLASFMAFMAMITLGRIAMWDFITEADPKFLWNLHRDSVLVDKSAWSFFLVFWEDVFFGMSIYWFMTRCKKWMAIPMVAAISVLFGQAHAYQGVYAIILTTFYPYFISYKLGKKYGFGTVQCGHILYDFVTYYTILFLPYLV